MIKFLSTASRTLIVSTSFILSSCILPPDKITSEYIPPQEMNLVNSLKKAKDYAQSGRLESAEGEYFKIYLKNPNVPSIKNDIAFVLEGQNRYREALDFYLAAKKEEPKNLMVRNNLARVYFALGKLEDSLKEYQELLKSYFSLWSPELTLVNNAATKFRDEDLVFVYRNMAIIYYNWGKIAEALCSSETAYDLSFLFSGDTVLQVSQAKQHIRLLMVAEEHDKAITIIQNLLALDRPDLQDLFFEYSLSLYAKGNFEYSLQAFSRAIASNRIEDDDKLVAKFWRVLLSSKSAKTLAKIKDEKFQKLMEEHFSEDELEELCKLTDFDRYGFWPLNFKTDTVVKLKEYCTQYLNL